MSKSDRNRSQSPKPRGQNVYASMGRPFTLRDIVPAGSTYNTTRMQSSSAPDDSLGLLGPLRNGDHSRRVCNHSKDCVANLQNSRTYAPPRSTDIANSCNETCYYFSHCPAARSARQQNTLHHVPKNHLAGAQKQQHLNQTSQAADRMNLQREMMKNEKTAFQRFRKEHHLAECGARPLAQEVYSFNVPAVYCGQKTGRQSDTERDLTYRRLSPVTPTKRRARSCPSPYASSHSSVQRMPKVCPGSVESKHFDPSSSISVARHFETPEHQSAKRSIQKRMENMAKRNGSPVRPQVRQNHIPDTLTTTTTTELTFPADDNAAPASDSNNERIMQGMYRLMDQNRSTSSRTPIPSHQTDATEKSYSSKRTALDEPNQFGRRPNEVLGGSYDKKTQCVFNDMDISSQEFPFHMSYALPPTECSKEGSKILPENLTYMDCSQASQKAFCPQPTMQTNSTACETLDNEYDSTQYLELPPSLPAPANYRPCEQPKATPHRSLEASHAQVADQTVEQLSAEWTFGTPGLCSTAMFGDLFDTPSNEAMHEQPASVKDCANAKRCGRVQFDSSDKQELQDPRRRAVRQAEIDNLVNDTYCPGIIQETVDGRENFNKYSFSIPDSRPGVRDPLTLLEAFSLRLDKEKTEMLKSLKEDFTAEQITQTIEQHFANKNPTELNLAIKSFLLAEQLQEHDDTEKTKGKSFEAEVHKWVTAWPGGSNMKLISYTGRTRPTEAEEATTQTTSD